MADDGMGPVYAEREQASPEVSGLPSPDM